MSVSLDVERERPHMRRHRLLMVVPSVMTLSFLACGTSQPPKTKIAITATRPDAGAAQPPAGSGQCTPWTEPRTELDNAKDAGASAADDSSSYDNSGRHRVPIKKGDLCETADSNIERAEKLILNGPGGAPNAPHAAWDHTSKPKYHDKVMHRLSLTKAERALLAKNNFVVMPRESFSTYAWALHEVYQSELPLYVSADSILHAVYTSNDHLLADIERTTLVPLLAKVLSAMHCALADASKSRVYPSTIAHDLDLYLTVARSLLADAPVPSVLGMDDQATKLIAAAKRASGMEKLELFERERLVDWSQYQPRGHYADPAPSSDSPSDDDQPYVDPGKVKPSLSSYFRAGMWLSRFEFNLVSRSSRSSLLGAPDPRETPREAIVGLALSDLVERASVTHDVARLDRAWTLLAGKREDVSPAEMSALRRRAGIQTIDVGAFDKLKAAIGSDFQRTARVHPMPEGSKVLPAIATFLGPRIVADTAAFRPLIHSEVDQRYLVHAGDVAYVLGLDRGKTYLAADLARHPALAAKLDEARDAARNWKDGGDLYSAWLSAVHGVAEKHPSSDVVPSFMQTTAYDDLRMNTMVAGYGQIRHNYVLMAAQSYDEGGCEIPDGYVEPAVATYDALVKYATRGASVMKELDPKDTTGALQYFAELEKIARVLGTISRHELEGRALSTEEQRWLSMVVEMTPGSTGGAPTYTGWYFDLFRGRWEEGLGDASFVADYHTSSWKGRVVYAGATSPRLGVFVIDANGSPRLAVGPVARAYEIESTLDKRLDDRAATKAEGKIDPWAASYTAPMPTYEPGFALTANVSYEKKPTSIVIRGGDRQLDDVTIELLDHHRVAMAKVTRTIPKNGKVVVSITTRQMPEGVRVRIGEWATESHSSGPEPGVSIRSGGVEPGADDYR